MKDFLWGMLAGALLGWCTQAEAADLPVKPLVKAAPIIAPYNPFYIGLFAGAGFSKTQSEITLDGVAQGPATAFPTGFLVGGVLGYANTAGPLYYGLTFEVAYDFSRGDVGCPMIEGTLCVGNTFRKNGILLQEGGEIGVSLAGIGGYIPSSAQPQNWPVPIVVPTSAWSNLIFAARGGAAQRDVTLCGTTIAADGSLSDACGSKFIFGPYIGAKLKAMLSAQTEVFVTYDHVFWNSSFTPTSATKLFSNTIAAKDEDLWKVGFGYHF